MSSLLAFQPEHTEHVHRTSGMILVTDYSAMVLTHPAGSGCMPLDALTYGYGLSLAFFLTNDQRPGPCGFSLASTCGFFGFLAFFFFFFLKFPFLSSDPSILNLSAGMVVGVLLLSLIHI